jgi:hypothetical protein
MGLLGEMLVERGALSVEQLQTGLSAHHNGDARLGTYLVEFGFIDERSLLEALAEQLGVPFISQPTLIGCLEGFDQGVMPRSMLERLRAVPFRKVQGRLQVAMSNPIDARGINRIASYTQMRVEPFVASDQAIDLALERVKEIVPVTVGATDVDLLTDVVGGPADFDWDDLWETRVRSELLLMMHSRPRAASKMLVASFPGLVPVNSEEVRPRGARVDSTNLLHQFAAATNAGGIGEILVRYAAQRLDRVCLFAVHHGKVSGWLGRGLPLGAPDPRSFSVFSEIPSIFWELEDSDRYLGPIPGGPVDDDLLKIFGPPPPTEILVVALEVKGRTKGYVMGDIPGRTVPKTVIDEMALAAHAAGDALASVLRGRS